MKKGMKSAFAATLALTACLKKRKPLVRPGVQLSFSVESLI